MSNPFNDDFFKFFGNFGKTRAFEIRTPDGSIYYFVTNTMDESTFEHVKHQLEEAAKTKNQAEFDVLWKQIQQQNNPGFEFNIEDIFGKGLEQGLKKSLDQVQQELGNLFKGFDPNELVKEMFGGEQEAKPKGPTDESLDKEIAKHEAEIARLKRMKENIDVEKTKVELQEKITKLKAQLDDKLDELRLHLNQKERKEAITDELTVISSQIEEAEKRLKELS